MSTISAAVAIVLFVRIVSASATWYRPAVEFGALGWVYIVALVVAVLVNYTCFVGMRPRLWAAPHVLRYRGYRISPSEKRR